MNIRIISRAEILSLVTMSDAIDGGGGDAGPWGAHDR